MKLRYKPIPAKFRNWSKQVICTVTLETFFKCLECPFDIVEAHVKHFDPPGNKSQVLLEEVLCEGIILKRK